MNSIMKINKYVVVYFFRFRRLFPILSYKVLGLERSTLYSMSMDIVPADEHHYKFSNNHWVTTGGAQPLPASKTEFH